MDINLKNIDIFNPWYTKGDFLFKENNFAKRRQYYQVEDQVEKELIISIVGLRRTGKTTIIRQIISSLLTKNIEAKRIFFYQFDEINNSIEGTLDFYFKNILKENLYETKCYIFLDELQFVENWQTVLKKYYDLNVNIKFIISGSTHLYLHKNTKESLAGRIADVKIFPFSWHEFLNFKYKKNYNFIKDIFATNFIDIVRSNSEILIHREEFRTFLSYGEFPYFFHETNALLLDNYFKDSILDKIFSQDIHLFDVENKKAFDNLFKILSRDTAQEINISNISRQIGLSAITIKKYIEILEKMFLYSYLYKQENSVRQQIGSFKKGHVHSLNLIRSSLNIDYWNISSEHFGHIIETFIYNELIKNGIHNITFYNNTKIKKEVDFIITDGKQILPIEVKITSQINPSHLKHLVFFMKENNLKRGIFIYGGDAIEVKKIDGLIIECLPYYLL